MVRIGIIPGMASALLVLGVGACSFGPAIDPRELERVDIAILEAKQSGAEQHAQRSLALAEERLALAGKRSEEGQEVAAARLLREAEVLAELAQAESLARESEQSLKVVQESLAALQRELGVADEP